MDKQEERMKIVGQMGAMAFRAQSSYRETEETAFLTGYRARAKEDNDHIQQLEADKARLEESCFDVRLGYGDKIVSDIYNEKEGWAGFCISNGDCPVGEDYKTDAKTTEEIGAFLKIMTSNPKSLDVIIDKCEKAKQWLLKEKGDE